MNHLCSGNPIEVFKPFEFLPEGVDVVERDLGSAVVLDPAKGVHFCRPSHVLHYPCLDRANRRALRKLSREAGVEFRRLWDRGVVEYSSSFVRVPTSPDILDR